MLFHWSKTEPDPNNSPAFSDHVALKKTVAEQQTHNETDISYLQHK